MTTFVFETVNQSLSDEALRRLTQILERALARKELGDANGNIVKRVTSVMDVRPDSSIKLNLCGVPPYGFMPLVLDTAETGTVHTISGGDSAIYCDYLYQVLMLLQTDKVIGGLAVTSEP